MLDYNSEELVPTTNPSTNLIPEDLVYLTDSTFCEADPAQGILGTQNRECESSADKPNSCNVLCCGRGAYRVQTSVPIEECNFVWCCEIVCSITGYDSISKYYCN